VMQRCKNWWRDLTCIVGLCICVGVLIQPQDFTHQAIPDWIEKESKSVPAKEKSHTLITSKQPDKSTRSHTEDNKQVSFRSLLSKRSSLLSSKCNSQSASTQSLRKRLLHVKSSSLLWCPVFKSASSSWTFHIIALSGSR